MEDKFFKKRNGDNLIYPRSFLSYAINGLRKLDQSLPMGAYPFFLNQVMFFR